MKILLGITAGIAAYKTPELVRRLRDRGAEVRVVMTRSAHQFVTATSLQAVSGEPVRDNLWDEDAEAAMGHIELARWADQVLIAPATAEFLSRLAQGSAGDLLTTLCLATEAPIAIAPAMNHVMWSNPAVQENVATVVGRGITILGPGVGDQACGETGAGRMLDVPDLVDAMFADRANGPLAGQHVIVTAGPTREPLDPVRYLSNHSSGKMGYAMARAAARAGAKVTLLSGPVDLATPPGVERIDFNTAQELHDATHERIDDCDVFIAAAAVADYRPASVAEQKIKKSEESLSLSLERSPDVLASVSSLAKPPFTVGFAAETTNLREHALAKLERKKLDMIIANSVGEGIAFGQDDNAVQVFWAGGEQAFETAAKTQLAESLIALIAARFLEAGESAPDYPRLATEQ